jgi:hypothetical protein
MLSGEAALVILCKPMLNHDSCVRLKWMNLAAYSPPSGRTTKDDTRTSKAHLKPPNVMKNVKIGMS